MSILPPPTATVPPPPPAARRLPPPVRQQLALDALAGQPITELARQQQVSRKFVYHQLHPAHDLSDCPLSLGSVHNILAQAVARARHVTDQQDLAPVRLGAHDEIFQAGRPVLVGADVASTYCYLLRPEEHRDADTWGVRLLELTERGFRPDATIADFAGGLRAGQAEALPGVPCRGDVFHALQTATPLVGYLENRAYEAIATRSRLEDRQARTEHRQGRKDQSLAAQLRYAREAERPALA